MWEHCRKKCYGVIADVHVHRGGIGMYEYLGNADWQDHTAKGTLFFSTGQDPTTPHLKSSRIAKALTDRAVGVTSLFRFACQNAGVYPAARRRMRLSHL